jgi:hypothetical protein
LSLAVGVVVRKVQEEAVVQEDFVQLLLQLEVEVL